MVTTPHSMRAPQRRAMAQAGSREMPARPMTHGSVAPTRIRHRRTEEDIVKQLMLLLIAAPPFGGTVYLNFEGLADGAPVDDSYAGFGIHFTNAAIQTKDMSLSPLFPPNDGVNVATDLPGSPMDIKFDYTYSN